MTDYKDTWDLGTIPETLLVSEYKRRIAAKRKTFGAGYNGGRPRSADRCPCGEMTRHRALTHKHQCVVDGQYPEVG